MMPDPMTCGIAESWFNPPPPHVAPVQKFIPFMPFFGGAIGVFSPTSFLTSCATKKPRTRPIPRRYGARILEWESSSGQS